MSAKIPEDRSHESLLGHVRARFADRLEVAVETVEPGSHLIDDLGAESIDLLVMVTDLEEEFGVRIPDEDLPALTTPDAIASKLAAYFAAAED